MRLYFVPGISMFSIASGEYNDADTRQQNYRVPHTERQNKARKKLHCVCIVYMIAFVLCTLILVMLNTVYTDMKGCQLKYF